MYLESIWVLTSQRSHVRAVDVAEHMGYSKPSVSRTMGLLRSGGYVELDGEGYLTLTPAGQAIGRKIYERHTLLTALLVNLGVDRETAAADACKLEHAISDVSFEAIKRHVQQFTQANNEK